MSLRKDSEIEMTYAAEGSSIKQYFDPCNTSNGIKYSLAQFTLESGEKSRLHRIRSSEIYYILEGDAILNVNGNAISMKKDDSVYVQPNASQSIRNSGKSSLKFLCIVEPAWNPDDETILE